MTAINLLPWRALQRDRLEKQVTVYVILGLVMSLIVVSSIDLYVIHLTHVQTRWNVRLQREIVLTDQKMKEISEITALRDLLVARMAIVKNLQASRSLTIHLLDNFVKIIPDSVYLDQIERVNDKITVIGHAESNTPISQLMRNMDASPWVEDPLLTDIKKTQTAQSIEDKSTGGNAFRLRFSLKTKTKVGPQ